MSHSLERVSRYHEHPWLSERSAGLEYAFFLSLGRPDVAVDGAVPSRVDPLVQHRLGKYVLDDGGENADHAVVQGTFGGHEFGGFKTAGMRFHADSLDDGVAVLVLVNLGGVRRRKECDVVGAGALDSVVVI